MDDNTEEMVPNRNFDNAHMKLAGLFKTTGPNVLYLNRKISLMVLFEHL